MTSSVVYVLVGDRDLELLTHSIRSVRRFLNVPITVYSDIDLKLSGIKVIRYKRRSYEKREEIRNSSLIRLEALLSSPSDTTLYLDNDVIIVSEYFQEGFVIANRFGLALPQNPRIFLGTEMQIGQDVSDHDKKMLRNVPKHTMTFNSGVIFYSRRSKQLVQTWRDEQLTNPSRGQMSMWRAFWALGESPHALPINWLVCDSHVGIANPLALHIGHQNIYDWWQQKFQNIVWI